MDNYNIIVNKIKVCNVCETEYPSTPEYFYRKKDTKDGLRNYCKECSKSKIRKYYQDNREKMRKQENDRRRSNPKKLSESEKEKARIRARVYYEKNKEKIKKQRKEQRKRNNTDEQKRRQSLRMSEYYKNNRDKILKNVKLYRQSEEGRRVQKIYNQTRKNREAGVVSDFTVNDWIKCKTYFDYRCCYCGKSDVELHQDHFVPLSKRGNYTKCNIVPSCETCNKRKHATLFFEWYPHYKYYDEERESKILKYLNQNIL